MRNFWTLSALVLVAACAKGKADAAASDTAAAASAAAASPAMAAQADSGMKMDTGMKMDSGMKMDPDKAMSGSGVPAGYTGVTDHADAKITDARYSENGGRWEIQTGPAHITFAPKDSASGVFGATATFEQLEKPKHPEAYGVFVGGSNLTDRAKQTYSYFVVRGTGEYLVKVRNGAKTSSVIGWTASPSVPKEDASGKATYKITVHSAADTVHFMVNGKLVAATPKSKFPTAGVAGIRVNHNLHVAVTPLVISR